MIILILITTGGYILSTQTEPDQEIIEQIRPTENDNNDFLSWINVANMEMLDITNRGLKAMGEENYYEQMLIEQETIDTIETYIHELNMFELDGAEYENLRTEYREYLYDRKQASDYAIIGLEEMLNDNYDLAVTYLNTSTSYITEATNRFSTINDMLNNILDNI